ncbi:hypothetical protein [Kitasatospora sp. NBC_00315]|uniref:hypothetical protein n=1 Tax=Kitasatospora sp. NBC_00315 TaxID=2975963 RepID=UPI003247EDAA
MTGPEDTEPAIPGQRGVAGGRHAAPRISARNRLRGRALAMAAVPTALLMGAVYSPTLASADTSAGKACASAPDTASDTVLSETPVPKGDLTPLPDPAATPSAPATAPSAPATTAPTTAASAPATAAPAVKAGSATGGQVIGAAYVVPVAGASAAPAAVQAGIIGDVLDGIGNLLHPSATPSPSASPSSSPAATRSAASPSGVASPSGAPAARPAPQAAAAPAASPAAKQPSASASPKAAAATPKAAAAPSPSASASANPNCAVDTRAVAARNAPGGDVVPEQNWTLRSSRLGLHGAVFNGVYDVHMVSGTKRVLKFTVDTVDIENLDMSTLQGNGKTFHVKGAPGSTSTMRKGPVTMYVERLSGHLSKILGLPIPIDLGEITLTPDTLPRWLWDLIGAVPIPLDMEMTGVEAVQAGQFGGTLKIPGMHLYNDDEPYTN